MGVRQGHGPKPGATDRDSVWYGLSSRADMTQVHTDRVRSCADVCSWQIPRLLQYLLSMISYTTNDTFVILPLRQSFTTVVKEGEDGIGQGGMGWGWVSL